MRDLNKVRDLGKVRDLDNVRDLDKVRDDRQSEGSKVLGRHAG